jgi:hypothetical protein
MDKNVLSPDQMNSIRTFNYKLVNSVEDQNLEKANGNLDKALFVFKKQNEVLAKNVSTLQLLLDSLTLKKTEGRPELVEDIIWNHYYYQNYKYKTHIMIVIIGVCIVINVMMSFVEPTLFPAICAIVLFVAALYITRTLWDLSTRDDKIFDEYDFGTYVGAHPRNNVYNTLKSKYTTEVDLSANCIVKSEKDSYKKL